MSLSYQEHWYLVLKGILLSTRQMHIAFLVVVCPVYTFPQLHHDHLHNTWSKEGRHQCEGHGRTQPCNLHTLYLSQDCMPPAPLHVHHIENNSCTVWSLYEQRSFYHRHMPSTQCLCGRPAQSNYMGHSSPVPLHNLDMPNRSKTQASYLQSLCGCLGIGS